MLGIIWLVFWVITGFLTPAVLLVALIFILMGLALRRISSRWMRIETLRYAAVLPESTLLQFTGKQPGWDEKALPLPFAIEVQSTRKAPIICFLLLAVLTTSLTESERESSRDSSGR